MKLPIKAFADMVEHLRSELPREGVGVLVSALDETCYVPLTNLASDEAHFCVSPPEWVSLLHTLDTKGERLQAIIHSHPATPPIPSEADHRGFHYPDVYLLIVSFIVPQAPEAVLYTKEGQRLVRCPFTVV